MRQRSGTTAPDPHGPRDQLVYVAMGSNLGDRLSNLQAALDALSGHPGVKAIRTSHVYETEALTLNPEETQPNYLNAVVELRSTLSPLELLEVCLTIERDAGRQRHGRWEPRTIDLDVLLYGEMTLDLPALRIPHPRMGERRFVLQPLSDLAGDLKLPAPLDATVYSLLQRMTDRGEVRRYPKDLVLPNQDD